MSLAQRLDLVSVEEYLRAEAEAADRNEYLGGVVYAMSGGTNRHNLIASNALLALGTRLRGSGCRAYNSDTKIRISLPGHVRFYYPDVSVICRPGPGEQSYQEEPALIVEVLSDSTRRIDEGEKKDAYLSLATLSTYLLVEPNEPAVVVYQRTAEEFSRLVVRGLEASISLPAFGFALPLAELYET